MRLWSLPRLVATLVVALVLACGPKTEVDLATAFPDINAQTGGGPYVLSEIMPSDSVALCYFYSAVWGESVITGDDIMQNCKWCEEADVGEQSFELTESLLIIRRGARGFELPIDPYSGGATISYLTNSNQLHGPCFRPSEVSGQFSVRNNAVFLHLAPLRSEEN